MPEGFEQSKLPSTQEHSEELRVAETTDLERAEKILSPEQQPDLELIHNVLQTGKPIDLEEIEGLEREVRYNFQKLDVILRRPRPDTTLFDKTKKRLEELGVSNDMMQKFIRMSLIKLATGYNLNILPGLGEIREVKEQTEAIAPETFQRAMKESVLLCMARGNMERAADINKQFDLPKEFIEEAAKHKMIGLLSDGHDAKVKEAVRLRYAFKLPPEVTNEATEIALKQLLSGGVWSEAEQFMRAVIGIKHAFGISEDFLSREINADVQHDLQEKLKEFTLRVFFEDTQAELDEMEKVFSIKIDELFSQSIHDKDLIGYITYLGDQNITALFPLSFAKIHERIFDQLSKDNNLADYFVENLDSYYQQPWVSSCVTEATVHYSVAVKFIHAYGAQAVWQGEPWAYQLVQKLEELLSPTQGKVEHDETDEGTGTFSERDPFENHAWRWGGQQVRLASVLAEAMKGNDVVDKLDEFGVGEGTRELLIKVEKEIEYQYKLFSEKIENNSKISEDDRQVLLNPEASTIKMIPLQNVLRSLVSRFLVQEMGDHIKKETLAGRKFEGLKPFLAHIGGVVKRGFDAYIQVIEVDLPLYDKLYEEFDTLRETGRSPLEVYLGRDGVYAYVGRRAQDVARRRKLGLQGRKEMREKGEILEIHPKYLVYPRYFRDNLNYETKRELLEQEGISPNADPLFYDTGYTGTIPEQIMRIMDFDEEDIERRIRLLSAPTAARRVKGIPENARQEVIEYIEHNAKSEESAIGLIKDERTGKIRHIAEPTNPTEQFCFMMIKQAIARHYWLQEQLHHEPSGNINLDSEHYTIRIRQEYAKLLPAEFIQNPKGFFAQHGELLKGSKGQGEYPDEEIVLFKLTDETEIVAKRIELRKAKEARKEFSILISAKKAGLHTAEPVGFLSGKAETDGGYLLMKKIEGISGRNLDKYLKGTGKYTEQQISDIMRQVAEKNKEMAELFRTTLKIDKRWRIKDTIIELNEETGEVESVIPIDFERVQNYDPENPKGIDEIE